MFNDVKTFIIATLFGLIGMYCIAQGKKRLNYGLLLSGAALIFFPYFTPSLRSTLVVGVILLGVAYWTSATGD